MKKLKLPSFPIALWLLLGQPLVSLLGVTVYASVDFAFMAFRSNASLKTSETIVTLIGFVVVIFVLLSMSRILSWTLSVFIAIILLWRGKTIKLLAIISLTPIFGFLLWYGYDHFVPDTRLMFGENPPYQHGFTWSRFFIASLIEFAIACGYWVPLRKVRLME